MEPAVEVAEIQVAVRAPTRVVLAVGRAETDLPRTAAVVVTVVATATEAAVTVMAAADALKSS